jgi:alanine dehydrogenase
MIIGVPRERKADERRVALLPDGVVELVQAGHQVIVEENAGELSGFANDEYLQAGASIAAQLSDIWQEVDLLVKVKEPAPEEVQYFRPGLAVFSFLHLAADEELTKSMVRSGVTGLDYDLLMLEDGRLPILEPMSIIAGKLSIQCGAYALQAQTNGRGVLLGGAPGVVAGKVVVLGAGAAGGNAARVAMGMGAEVTVLDINPKRLQPFSEGTLRARTLFSTSKAIEREVRDADLVIGSVLIPGALAPKLISEKLVQMMQPGSVLVDICIDQGGCAETSKSTRIIDPTYVSHGVVHYCVPNMPALVPRTSTQALTAASLPWIKEIANRGIQDSIKSVKPIRLSLTSYQGNLTNKAIGDAVGIEAVDPSELI